MSSTLLLVDMAALAFRAHYAFINRPLTRSDGFVTSALYGTCNTLLSVIEQVSPTHIACAMDSGGPTFRHEMYPDYKANRPPCPPDLYGQLQKLDELCDAFSLKYVARPGFEADDIIGTLTLKAHEQGCEVIILSGDKDFMQLIRPGVTMMLPKKGNEYETLNEQGVVEKIGVKPNQVIEYLSLLGDASDNVPGAPGVGKVTAAKLLQEHQNLKGIFSEAPNFKKRGLGAKVLDHKDQIILSKELVTIKTDMDEMPEIKDLAYGGYELKKAKPFLVQMEFPKILSRVETQTPNAERKNERDVKTVTTEISDLSTFDFETFKETIALYPVYANNEESIQAVAFSDGEGKANYIRISSEEDLESLLEKLTTCRSRQFGLHDAKPFLKILHALGMDMDIQFDTYLQSTVLLPGKNDQSLESRTESEFVYLLPELSGKGKSKQQFSDLSHEEAMTYAGERADFCLRLQLLQKNELNERGLQSVVDDLEMKLLPVIAWMEENGIRVDSDILGEFSRQAKNELEELTQKIYQCAGEEFNINSTQQLGVVLFEKMKIQDVLGLKKIKKTKTGYSTDAKVLEKLSGHEIGGLLLRYRFLSKLKSTYFDALPMEVDPKTGRIHTHYLQNGTATGRLSSHRPNLQNIPMKTPEGAKIREAFIPSDDESILISADYSQIELRVLAHFCRDEVMLEAFNQGEDIHRATAAKVFGLPLEKVDRFQRSSAKSVNFGLLYGMGPRHLAEDTGMEFKEAQKFIKDYFANFPKIRSYMTECIDIARERGYVETLSGRRRELPDLNSSNGMLRNAAENMALNTPIQGSAADLIKWAMIKLNETIHQSGWELKILLQVHDELVFECKKSKVEELKENIITIMEDTSSLGIDFDVPLVVEANAGANWLAAH